MKVTILLVVSLAALLAVTQAQGANKGKGEACVNHDECAGGMKCAESICGCKSGHSPVFESHGDSSGTYVCKKVVGQGCNHESECSDHLTNSKCENNLCVCNKEDNCKDGAVTLTVMSLTTMMAIVVGLLKVW